LDHPAARMKSSAVPFDRPLSRSRIGGQIARPGSPPERASTFSIA
jgi:hypothetical protein